MFHKYIHPHVLRGSAFYAITHAYLLKKKQRGE